MVYSQMSGIGNISEFGERLRGSGGVRVGRGFKRAEVKSAHGNLFSPSLRMG